MFIYPNPPTVSIAVGPAVLAISTFSELIQLALKKDLVR